jgi:aminopeptidase N
MTAELAMNHFRNASGMTDKVAALSALASIDGEGESARDEALEIFYKDANGDALVLNKWFMMQALADLPDVLERVKKLKEHPDFTLKNPNDAVRWWESWLGTRPFTRKMSWLRVFG